MTNLEKAKACVDQEVKEWNKTSLSFIEKDSIEQHMIWGIVKMALYFLNFDDYCRLKQYIYDEYGYNVGGVKTEDIYGE